MIEPIRLTFEVACPVDRAFETWTGRIAQWWPADHTVTAGPGLTVVLEGRAGGRLFERTMGGIEHDWGEVTIWEPPRRLAYTWHLKRDRADATEVEVRFVAQGEAATRVEIEHRGWDRLGADGETWRDRNHGGWATLLPHYVDAAGRRPRWAGDERLTGPADGSAMVGALDEMSAAMSSAGWLTEEPIAHLGPALAAWLAGDRDRRWGSVVVAADGAWLIVTAEWPRTGGRMRDLRADAYALIGSVVEDVAHVVQRRADGIVEFEVATGQPASGFAAHGHFVRLRATGREVERALSGTSAGG